MIKKDLRVLFRTGIEQSIIRKDVVGEVCKIIPTKHKNLWYFNKEIKVGDKCSFETIIDNEIVRDNAYILDDVFGERKLKIRGDKGSEEIDVVFDSGTTRSVIPKGLAEKFTQINRYDKPKSMETADKDHDIKIIGFCDFSTVIKGCDIEDTMRVVDSLNADIIIKTNQSNI